MLPLLITNYTVFQLQKLCYVVYRPTRNYDIIVQGCGVGGCLPFVIIGGCVGGWGGV